MKPRLLDLFCGAGGAAMGYHRAGFDVAGVDIAAQPNYPFAFYQADALEFPLYEFDVIHASPPCQSYSRALRHMAAPKPMLIDVVRECLRASGVPWVIENVEGAPMARASDLSGNHGQVLCGTAFGLRIKRHRIFETSFSMPPVFCGDHDGILNPIEAAGRERMFREWGGRERMYAELGPDAPEVAWRREMGVEWMSRYEAREAIPPAYTEHIGGYLLAALTQKAAA